ncbi:hypothetical protein [Variovorax sp. PvP013]|uniref:hypothetical protein n=1 Tax=Variovorax sp. PvP013 TaxID=3156435 RepID=UPI003D258532
MGNNAFRMLPMPVVKLFLSMGAVLVMAPPNRSVLPLTVLSKPPLPAAMPL